MSEQYSRRSFLSGVLTCGALSASAVYLVPGGHRPPPAELRLATGADPTGARKLLMDMWNQANPDTPVRFTDEVEGGSGDERKRLLTAAQNGSADILNLDIVDIPEFAAQKLITPIRLTDPNFLTSVKDLHQVADAPNSYWAAPLNADVGMLFWRNPETDQPDKVTLSLVLGTFAAADKRSFVGQLRPNSSNYNEGFLVNILEHALSVDPELLSPTGEILFELKPWQEALRPLRAAIGAGKVTLSSDENASLDTFVETKPTFMRNWPVKYRELQQRKDSDLLAGKIQVHPLKPGVLGGQSLALVRTCPHPDQALRFINFMTGAAAQKILAGHGFAPTLAEAYNDRNLQAVIPHLEALRGAVEGARPRPMHPGYRTFAEVFVDHTNQMLTGESDLTSEFIAAMKAALG
ncbi:extracellular solute-binding protein [Micromonospora matsumotoense]|uniref:extracellular solute-binding protein n=1 Tax=Micromonospora matsumotoense TaxID=121616 RepID=UPI003D9045EA